MFNNAGRGSARTGSVRSPVRNPRMSTHGWAWDESRDPRRSRHPRRVGLRERLSRNGFDAQAATVVASPIRRLKPERCPCQDRSPSCPPPSVSAFSHPFPPSRSLHSICGCHPNWDCSASSTRRSSPLLPGRVPTPRQASGPTSCSTSRSVTSESCRATGWRAANSNSGFRPVKRSGARCPQPAAALALSGSEPGRSATWWGGESTSSSGASWRTRTCRATSWRAPGDGPRETASEALDPTQGPFSDREVGVQWPWTAGIGIILPVSAPWTFACGTFAGPRIGPAPTTLVTPSGRSGERALGLQVHHERYRTAGRIRDRIAAGCHFPMGVSASR